MRKNISGDAKAGKFVAKRAEKKLAAIRPAAQKPVHATRADIRRAVLATRAHADG